MCVVGEFWVMRYHFHHLPHVCERKGNDDKNLFLISFDGCILIKG